ncbi:hypothetical protein AAZX31_17G016800 [Glycine max]
MHRRKQSWEIISAGKKLATVNITQPQQMLTDPILSARENSNAIFFSRQKILTSDISTKTMVANNNHKKFKPLHPKKLYMGEK